jgi:F-type H+-transporting ATPase subunit b
MFLQPDGTFWVQLINFAIFFVLLNVLFFQPVSRAIMKRREYINSVTADYDTYQAEANALRAQAEDVRAGARRDAEAIVAKARADASNQSADLALQYGQKAQAIVEDARRTVGAELTAARANQDQTVRELASLMVDRTVVEAAK